MRQIWCTASCFIEDEIPYGFSIAEGQTKETFRYNENALWVGGQLTPLPPVKITMPEGPEGDWIIQDLEGMVDLIFTPKEQLKFEYNFLVTRSSYRAPPGVYNGMIVTLDGKQIPIHNLEGMGEIMYIRV
jgi:hypothetical protein